MVDYCIFEFIHVLDFTILSKRFISIFEFVVGLKDKLFVFGQSIWNNSSWGQALR
jgi:hypothetical protein